MKGLLVLLAGAMTLLVPVAQAQSWGAYRYVHDQVNIRQERSTASAVVGQLDRGDRVLVDFCTDVPCGSRVCVQRVSERI